MTTERVIEDFLSQYNEQVSSDAQKLRKLLLATLPNITEQFDAPARMIAYCYGQKYSELICVIIPSKKGLKLGFNNGVELPDPTQLLKGSGKISRYVEILSEQQINSAELKNLLQSALVNYKQRISK